ncbi:unnamed protein product [Symbiodinium natans]|uniref:Uncharacterized protein n=1 Tax=Symbiodinium natans TaxID=878477 RepID=A0A812PVK9_9DINO|nr:unnamed protein product [Symbiodinium natans]
MQLARLVAATCVAGSSAHALLPNRTLGQVYHHQQDIHESQADHEAGPPRAGARSGILQPGISLRHVGAREAPDDAEEGVRFKEAILNSVAGSIFLFLALSVQWFNEERSAKIEVLLTRGLEDCKRSPS